MENVETTIRVELHLCFDSDVNVYEICRNIPAYSVEMKNRNETLLNPITHKHNCGYWTYETSDILTVDVQDAFVQLQKDLMPHLEELKKIAHENGALVFLDVIPFIKLGQPPAIYFDSDIMRIVKDLNAEIRLDMYFI